MKWQAYSCWICCCHSAAHMMLVALNSTPRFNESGTLCFQNVPCPSQIPHTSIRPSLAPEDRSARSPSPQPVRGQSPDLTPRRSSSSFTQASSSSPTGRRSFLNSNQQSPLQQQHSSQQQTSEQHLQQQQLETVTCWSSTDRLNVSIGLMYALCNLAKELGAAAGFCVPRPQLLRRWLQVRGGLQLLIACH